MSSCGSVASRPGDGDGRRAGSTTASRPRPAEPSERVRPPEGAVPGLRERERCETASTPAISMTRRSISSSSYQLALRGVEFTELVL